MIVPKLTLNNNPKESENGCLVYAQHVQLNKEGTTIENESTLNYNRDIHTFINSVIKSNYDIVHSDTTSHELILFVCKYENPDKKLYIFRYNEETKDIKFFTNKLTYNGGELNSICTYNSKNQLIITICENNTDTDNPLKSFNVGDFKDGYNTINEYNAAETTYLTLRKHDDVYCDKFLNDEYLISTPKVILPNNINISYYAGRIYKGVYDIFIRYKINKYDYTNWFNIGDRIVVDSLNRYNIIKYNYNMKFNESVPASLSTVIPSYGFALGCSDYMSDDTEISNYTFNIDFIDKNINYFQYQFAFIINRKDSTKVYRTNDINLAGNSNYHVNYTVNQIELVEYDITSIITTNNTYYNVKTLDCYKNRLYIANYKTFDSNVKEDVSINIDFESEFNSISYKNLNLVITNNNINNDWQVTSKYTNLNNTKSGIYCFPLTDLFHLSSPVITETTPSSVTYKYWVYVYINIQCVLNWNNGKTNGQWAYGGYVLGYTANGKPYDGNNNTIVLSDNPNEFVPIYRQTDSGGFVKDSNQISFRHVGTSIDGTTKNIVVIGNNDVRLSGNNSFISCPYITSYDIDSVISQGSKSVKGQIETIVLEEGETTTYTLSDEDCLVYDDNVIQNNFKIHYKGEYIDLSEQNNTFTIIDSAGISHSFNLNNGESDYYYGTFFIDGNQSFLERINPDNKSLIPGAFYAFYIHFIDDYGNATNGVNINNLNSVNIAYNSINVDISKYNLYYIGEYSSDNLYKFYIVSNPIDTISEITIQYILEYNVNTTDKTLRTYNEFKSTDYYNYTKDNIDKYINSNNILWQDIVDYDRIGFNIVPNKYIYNDITYFKIPYDVNYVYTTDINVVNYPSKYKGYFISNVRIDSVIYKGIVSTDDVSTQSENYWNVSNQGSDNISKSNDSEFTNYKFFSDEININDELKNNISKIIVFSSSNTNELYNDNFFANNAHYLTNFNKVFNYNSGIVNIEDIENINFVNAYSTKNNLYNIGSYISFNASLSIMSNNGKIIPTVAHLVSNKLNFDNNNLVRCSDYYYGDYVNPSIYNDGMISIAGVLVYNSNGVIITDAEKLAVTSNNIKYIKEVDSENITGQTEESDSINNYTPFVLYGQYPVIDSYLHESKSFNNEPQIITKVSYTNDKISKYSNGSIVSVANSRDLFVNKSIKLNENVIIIYNSIYADNFINEFTKTINRSIVNQDESGVNYYRIITGESYKNITENKGEIIKIISNNTTMLIHTRYGLFKLDASNKLNNEVQLANTDIFEMDYNEITIDNKGEVGLQNPKHSILGKFGYIWYNEINKHIYKYDNSITYIDQDIIYFLNHYNFTNLVIVDDIKRNRLLFINTASLSAAFAISYNYKTNNFISVHEYSNIIEGINTAYNTYLIFNYSYINIQSMTDIHYKIICYFDDVLKGSQPVNLNQGTFVQLRPFVSTVSVLYSRAIETIKRLSNIIYRLEVTKNIDNYSIELPVKNANEDFYAGDAIRIYSNFLDTGELNVLIDSNDNKNKILDTTYNVNRVYYNKPYWHNGNWNFNFVFDTKYVDNDNEPSNAYIKGNYFIAKIIVNNTNGDDIQFKNVDFKLLNF